RHLPERVSTATRVLPGAPLASVVVVHSAGFSTPVSPPVPASVPPPAFGETSLLPLPHAAKTTTKTIEHPNVRMAPRYVAASQAAVQGDRTMVALHARAGSCAPAPVVRATPRAQHAAARRPYVCSTPRSRTTRSSL